VLEVNPMRNQVELTLKTATDVAAPAAKSLGYGDFVEGQKVAVVVKEVREYGMFLRIADSAISGLCHKSEISDETKGDVGKALKGFRAGDQLKAVITTLDPAARKIAFSIKPSHFADEDFAGSEDDDSASDDDDDDDDDAELQDKILQMIGAEDDSDDEAGEGAEEEEDEDDDMSDGSAADEDDVSAI
jgi:rRNA biogenesis protein RRP5